MLRHVRYSAIAIVTLVVVFGVALVPASTVQATPNPNRALDGAWAQYRFGPAGTGFNPSESKISASNVAGLQRRWSETSSVPALESSPVVANGVVYASTSAGRLDAFDATSGSAKWSFVVGSGDVIWSFVSGSGAMENRVSPPAVANGVVYDMAGDGTLYAVDASSGHELWSTSDGEAVPSAFTVADGFVYVANSNALFAFNATTGALAHTAGVYWPGVLVPAVANGIVYFSYEGMLMAYGAATFRRLWGPSGLTAGPGWASIAVANGAVYATFTGKLYAFDAASGARLWSATGSGSPAVAHGAVYDSDDDGTVSAFNATNGELLWSTATGGTAAASAAVVANGVVYVGDSNGKLDAFNAATGARVWSSPSTGTEVEPIVAAGVVYASSNDASSNTGHLDAYSSPLAGARLTVSPTFAPDYGTIAYAASSPPTTFTVTNFASTDTTTLSDGIAGADPTQFHVTAETCKGKTLPARSSCKIAVAFAPTLPGQRTAHLTVTAASGGIASALLSGTGNVLTITPASKDYGAAYFNTSSPPTMFTITNLSAIGTTALADSLPGADPTQFRITADTCARKSLAGRTSCNIAVAFAPTLPGVQTATLAVNAAVGGNANANLSGIGIGLAIDPASTDYGLVLDGTRSQPTTFTVTNFDSAATSAITDSLSGPNPSRYRVISDTCAGVALAAGATCTIAAEFVPTLSGVRRATLTAHAATGGTTNAVLSGTADPLGIDPESYDFGSVPDGTATSPTTFTVTNRSARPVSPTVASLAGSQFTATSDACSGATLAPGASCEIAVRFTAPAGDLFYQYYRASVAVSSAPSITTTAVVYATSTQISITPPTKNYGTVPVGSSAPATFTITDTSSAPLPISFYYSEVTGSGFSITSDGCYNVDLAAGASCNIVVTFTPTVSGAMYQGVLTPLLSFAGSINNEATLVGTGG
jgi:outer membrane protein assembly factor BamB